MRKIFPTTAVVLTLLSNHIVAQSTTSTQVKAGFVSLANEQIVVQSKAIAKPISGVWKVPAGGAFKIRVIAKGARASDTNGITAEPGDIVTGEFIVYSGQTLRYSLGISGPTGGNTSVYVEGGRQMITAAGGMAPTTGIGKQHSRSFNGGINQKISSFSNFSAGEVTLSILAVCSTACGGDGGSGGGGGGTTCNSVAGTISSDAAGAVCPGTNSTTLTLSGYQGTIQWQSSTDNSNFADISGATSATYTAANLTQTTYYRAVVTDGTCPSATSSSMAVTVISSIAAGTITGNQQVCSGGTANLSITGYTDGASIQWQSSTDGTSFSDVNGATSATYSAPNLTTATYYQVIVNGCSLSATSPSFEVTIAPPINSGALSGGTTVCPGTNSTLLTLSGATVGATIEWDSSTDNQTFVPIPGATGTTYTATDLFGTAYYRVVVSNPCGSPTTNVVQVNVTPVAQAGTISGGGVHVCSGTNGTTLTLSGYSEGSIQWDSSINNSTFVPIPNATGTTYTATNLSATSYYEASVTNTCGTATTNAVQITVDPLLVWVMDADKDGHYFGDPVSACYSPVGPGWTQFTNQQPGDCDDNDFTKWQSQLLYIDNDGDGYDSGHQVVCYGSTIPAGYSATTLGPDCNDHDATIHAAVMYYVDNDHDGYGSTTTALICASSPPVGYSTNNTDCNDNDATKWQSQLLYIDNDGDGYDAGQIAVCYGSTIPPGYRIDTRGPDCNDSDPAVHDALLSGSISGGGVSVCPGTNSTLLTLSGNSSGSIQWQSSTNNSSFNNISGATGSTYTAINLRTTTYYQTVVKAGTCPSATSASVAITMGTLQNATSMTTTNITSTTAVLNWVSSYSPGQWQVEYKSTTPGSKWIDPPLLAGSLRSLLIKNLQPNQSYQWHIRASCGKSWTSYSVAITFKTLSSSITTASIGGNVSTLLARLQLKVLPNPTNTNFTISVQGNGRADAVKLVVLDMYGRIMEQRTLSNQQTITLGDSYRPGVYIVRVVQADQSQELKMIKLPY